MADFQEIQRYLPDATDQQAQRFATQLERLEKLQDFFQAHPEDRHRCQEMLARAEKALDYKRPYRITVIGTTGVGKSTMLNAMLGRELVLMREGKPATGAALQIFLDVAETGRETAVVQYRDEASIRQLITQFLERYHISNQAKMAGQLDASYAAALSKLEPSPITNEQALSEFLSLRETLTDLVTQYTNHRADLPQLEEYYLDQENDCENLLKLTDENSSWNKLDSPQRRIGLIQSVTYHIKPHQNFNGVETLKLPNNVCLVDLPGLDGSPLHDIIIAEGIQDADAVLFMLRPPRILGRGDAYLLERVRKYISLEGSVQSGERIFLVLNARDSIMVDNLPNTLPRDMAELMNLLVPGYAAYPATAKRGGEQPYFLTSAWAAYHAQKKIQDGQIKDPGIYETTKERLGARGKSDIEVLIASQVPKLVEELMRFAREHRIEGQIRDSETAIDRMVESLCKEYEREQQQLGLHTGIYSAQTQLKKTLEKQQQNLEYMIRGFRASLLDRLGDWRGLLMQDVKGICDAIDNVLKEKLPTVWENAFNPSVYIPGARLHGHVGDEQVLGNTEIALWHQLAFRFPALTTHLIQLYTDAIEAFMLPQKIEENCFGATNAVEIRAQLNRWIDQGMRQKMTEVSERIALTVMTDPTGRFIPAVGVTADNNLLKTCKQIPRQPKITNLSELEPLITAIRKHYEPIVSNFCVTALLNVYQYELLLIEDHLLNAMSEIFEMLPRTIDPNVQAGIDALISADPNWRRMTLLERKLFILNALRPRKPEPIDHRDQAAA